MRERIASFHKELMYTFAPEPIEVLLGTMATLWGFWLVLPFDTFASSPAFGVMAQLAPEMLWGGVILTIGLMQLFMVVVRRIIPERPCYSERRLLVSLSATVWIFIAVMFIQVNPL